MPHPLPGQSLAPLGIDLAHRAEPTLTLFPVMPRFAGSHSGTGPFAGSSQIVSFAAAGALFVIPDLLDVHEAPSSCAPCDRAGVPGFDRWAITKERSAWSVASTAALLVLGGATLLDLAVRDEPSAVVASLEAAAWAVSLTEVLKSVAARNRPVLYTDDAQEAAGSTDSRRSVPSGHAAAAAALATSYWLHARPNDRTPKIVALAIAAGVGAMRVVAGRHFPSDVLAGTAVGVGTAVVVDLVRF